MHLNEQLQQFAQPAVHGVPPPPSHTIQVHSGAIITWWSQIRSCSRGTGGLICIVKRSMISLIPQSSEHVPSPQQRATLTCHGAGYAAPAHPSPRQVPFAFASASERSSSPRASFSTCVTEFHRR